MIISSRYLLLWVYVVCHLFLYSSMRCFGILDKHRVIRRPVDAQSRPHNRHGQARSDHYYHYYPEGRDGQSSLSSYWNIARARRRSGYRHQPGSSDQSNMLATRFGGHVYGSADSITYLKLVRVDDHGAIGDGQTDDTEAFKKAWEKACSSDRGVFVVPNGGVYHLKPITLSGPCQSGFRVKIYGKIRASNDPSDYEEDTTHWLVFENLEDLRVEGGGSIDGNGHIWWSKSCKVDTSIPCKTAPTAVTFNSCTNLRVADLTIKNAQQMHLTFRDCVNVRATNLRIVSPESSPNTDGIHVVGTKNILIDNSRIQTGDDCVSIVSGSQQVEATNIECGPGHGISIGSLGADNSKDYVSDVYVHGAKLSGTTNGVRIKTWQGGSGYAKNIRFQNIAMDNVTNPIIIDQNYCDQDKPCHEQGSAVQVSNVAYENIRGTSATEIAMKFDCSRTHPCQEISLKGINLRTQQQVKGYSATTKAEAYCVNVELEKESMVYPNCS